MLRRLNPGKLPAYWGALVAFLLVIILTGAQPLPEPQVPDILCESAEECFENAVYFAENNPHLIARQVTQFHWVQEKYPGTLWGRRAGLRIGLALLDQDPAQAVPFLRMANRDFPLIGDYVQLWMGRALRGTDSSHQVPILLESLLEQYPQSVLRKEVLYDAGFAWYDGHQCHEASRYFHQAITLDSTSVNAPRAWYAIADCADRLQQSQRARDALREIWLRYPDSPEARIVNGIVKTGQPVGLEWTPSAGDFFRRAKTFYGLARFEHAIDDLQTFLTSRPRSPSLEQGQFKLGMAHVRLKQYDQAAKIFRRLSSGRSAFTGQATEWLARVYLRQGKGQPLLALRKSASSLLKTSERSQIHWMCGIWFEDQDKFQDAISSYQKAARLTGSSTAQLKALWRMGWLQYQRGLYQEAQDAFQRILKRTTDRFWISRAQYWQARTLGKLGKVDEALKRFRRVTDEFPITYYGQLAQTRLREYSPGLAADAAPPRLILQGPSGNSSLQRKRHYQKAQELKALGLKKEAAKELLEVVDEYKSNPETLSEVAIQLAETGSYDSALILAKRYFRDSIERGQISQQSPMWGVAYPTGYVPNIQSYADSGVDPYLVAGIIREESLYNPEALSPVGAVGLMQLMPATAQRVARQLGISPVNREDLFIGDTNIRLGVSYVRQLLQEFGGNLIRAVAAYNAGPEAVNRWVSRYGDQDPDEFVELISYKETRGYVKRVLTSYRVYHYLKSTTCSAPSLDKVC